jgi:uncharacterized protein
MTTLSAAPLGVMMALGSYRFSLATAAYDRLTRAAAWRWPSQEVIGGPPVRQSLGPAETTLELTGILYPHYKGLLGLPNLLARVPGLSPALGAAAGVNSALAGVGLSAAGLAGLSGAWGLEGLRADAGRSQPLLMVDGRGRVWGYWCLLQLREMEERHFADGAALKIEFAATLGYYGDTAPAAVGASLGGAVRGWLGL